MSKELDIPLIDTAELKEAIETAASISRELQAMHEDNIEHQPCEDESCQECCEHEFDSEEGYMCLNCGKDGMESVMVAAHERCEGER